MSWQDADDAVAIAMGMAPAPRVEPPSVSAAPTWNVNDVCADDALELAMRGIGGGGGSERSFHGDSSKPSLPQGWEATTSRSTGQTYYINTLTQESQYDLPTAPAKGSWHLHANPPPLPSAPSERDRDHGGGNAWNPAATAGNNIATTLGPRGNRISRKDETSKAHWTELPPDHDPKGKFLDFDAHGSNLQSSRELFMLQQQQKRDGGDDKGKSSKKDKRSRSKKRKKKKSTSSSSSSDKKQKRKATKEQTKQEEEERIARIKKAREARKQAPKSTDGGSVIDEPLKAANGDSVQAEAKKNIDGGNIDDGPTDGGKIDE